MSNPSTEDMQLIRAGSFEAIEGPDEWFTGKVRIEKLFTAPAPARVGVAIVKFEPGARTNWHTHPLGQILMVTEGRAWAGRSARTDRRPRFVPAI